MVSPLSRVEEAAHRIIVEDWLAGHDDEAVERLIEQAFARISEEEANDG